MAGAGLGLMVAALLGVGLVEVAHALLHLGVLATLGRRPRYDARALKDRRYYFVSCSAVHAHYRGLLDCCGTYVVAVGSCSEESHGRW